MDLGFVLIREMTVKTEEVHTHRSLETGRVAHHARPHREVPGSVRRQTGMRGEHGPEPLLGILWVGMVEQDR